MTIEAENLREKFNSLKGRPWQGLDIVTINNHKVRLTLCKGDYGWHKHDNADEFFLVTDGKLCLQIKGQKDLILRKNEYTVIPKGSEHNLVSLEETCLLVFEPIHMQTSRVKP